MLEAACWRGERRMRYRLDTLIARQGADAGLRVTVRTLTVDCARRESAALVERCDVLFPDLRVLFQARGSIG